MSKNKLININLNQTISRFELAEIQKENNRWIIFYVLTGLFVFILGFNLFTLTRYNNLIELRINKIQELISETETIKKGYESELDVSISESDINNLYVIEEKRISIAGKLQSFALDLPDKVSLKQFEYDYDKRRILIDLVSEIDYTKNKEELLDKLTKKTAYDGDFEYVDIVPADEKTKGQNFSVLTVIIDLKKKRDK